ncbi:MAG: hypothetical protein AAFX99_33915, partial [Myxococcota bacterium]
SSLAVACRYTLEHLSGQPNQLYKLLTALYMMPKPLQDGARQAHAHMLTFAPCSSWVFGLPIGGDAPTTMHHPGP